MSEQKVSVSVEQRIVIKFLTTEDVQPWEILQTLEKLFGEEYLSRTRGFERCKTFKEGMKRVENTPHNRRYRTSMLKCLYALL